MAQRRSIGIQFPVAGIVRSTAFQSQPPYSCNDAQNVLPRSQSDERGRGGRRPGTRKAFQQLLGSGQPVRTLATVRPIITPGAVASTDEFSGTAFSNQWSQLDSLGELSVNQIGIIPSGIIFGGAYSHSLTTQYKLHSVPGSMDTSGTWDLYFSCYLQSMPNGLGGWLHEFWVRLDNSAPDITADGVRLRIISGNPLNSGTTVQVWTISEIVGGLESGIASGQLEHAFSPNFTVNITRSGATSIFYINGTQLHSGTFTNSNSKQRFAIGMAASPSATIPPDSIPSAAIIDRMVFNYTGLTATEVRADRAAAISNGTLYVEDATGGMAAVSGSVSIRDDAQIRAQGRLAKLFIADYSAATKANASNGTTNGSPGTTFDSASYADWTALSIDKDEDVLVITSPLANAGTYKIATVASGSLTLATSPGLSLSGIVFTIERGPKVYDSDTGTLELWMATTAGFIPTRCPLIALSRSRMYLGGARGSEHLAYQSAIGDPFDWDFGTQIPGGAIAMGVTPQGDTIATPLTAIVAFSDDYVLFGCRNELFVQRGDLHFGGGVFNLSREIGIVGRGAWCWGPNGECVFLSRDGLYGMAPGASSFPQRISRDVIPKELRDIDLENSVISMAFDIRFGGVNIFVTPTSSTGSGKHWWFDWSNKGFFPMKFSAAHQPFSCVSHDLLASSQRSVLMGCRDGYIRTMDDAALDDDGTAIDSYVTMGPFMLGDGSERIGVVQSLQAKMAVNSGDVNWSLLVGDDAELAAIATARETGTFTAGHNPRPGNGRINGFAGYLKLASSVSDVPWAFEQIVLQLKLSGLLRVA